LNHILAEYAAVLARSKFGFPADEIAALMTMLRERGESVAGASPAPASRDPGDTKFLACAQAARAFFLVTGNKRHFPDSPYGPTYVVSAGELLDRIALEL